MNVLGHDGNALGMNGTQIGIFEETNQIGFRRFLKSRNGRRLEAKICLKLLGNFSNKTLEGKLPNQQLSRFLEAADLTKSNSSRPKAMWLLDPSRYSSGCRLLSPLGCNRFSWSFSSSGLASGLFRTRHHNSTHQQPKNELEKSEYTTWLPTKIPIYSKTWRVIWEFTDFRCVNELLVVGLHWAKNIWFIVWHVSIVIYKDSLYETCQYNLVVERDIPRINLKDECYLPVNYSTICCVFQCMNGKCMLGVNKWMEIEWGLSIHEMNFLHEARSKDEFIPSLFEKMSIFSGMNRWKWSPIRYQNRIIDLKPYDGKKEPLLLSLSGVAILFLTLLIPAPPPEQNTWIQIGMKWEERKSIIKEELHIRIHSLQWKNWTQSPAFSQFSWEWCRIELLFIVQCMVLWKRYLGGYFLEGAWCQYFPPHRKKLECQDPRMYFSPDTSKSATFSGFSTHWYTYLAIHISFFVWKSSWSPEWCE